VWSFALTQKVIGREVVRVPHLQREACRDLVLCLIPGEHGLLLGDDDLLLGHQVVEGVDEAPVEVALARDGVVVHVGVLLVLLLPLQPAARRRTCGQGQNAQRRVQQRVRRAQAGHTFVLDDDDGWWWWEVVVLVTVVVALFTQHMYSIQTDISR